MKQLGQRLTTKFTSQATCLSGFDGSCPSLILPDCMFLSKLLTARVVIPEFMSLTEAPEMLSLYPSSYQVLSVVPDLFTYSLLRL